MILSAVIRRSQMSSQKVTLDNFASAVEKILDDYDHDVERNVKEITHKVAQTGAKALQSRSASTQFGKRRARRTGKYARGWSARSESGRLTVEEVIYNKDRYQIAHLLEHGYALRNGGRKAGVPHIAPVEQEIIRNYEEQIISVITK